MTPEVFTEIPLDRMLAATAPDVQRDPVTHRITQITVTTPTVRAQADFGRDPQGDLESVTWTLEDV